MSLPPGKVQHLKGVVNYIMPPLTCTRAYDCHHPVQFALGRARRSHQSWKRSDEISSNLYEYSHVENEYYMYIRKRILCIRKRILYIRKRTLHSKTNTMHSKTNTVHYYSSKRTHEYNRCVHECMFMYMYLIKQNKLP